MLYNTNKDIIYICMPKLSIWNIIQARKKFKKKSKLFYDTFSLSFKFILKITRLSEEKLIKIISKVSGLTIIKIGDANTVKGYSNIQFSSMEQTTELIGNLIPQIKKGSAYNWLVKLIGDVPAEAFSIKNTSHYVLFPNLLALNVCYNQQGRPNNFIIISDYFGSHHNIKVLQNHLDYADIVPYRQSFIGGLFIFFYEVSKMLNLFLKFIFKRGITFKKIKKQKFKLITEFIDPKRLNGLSYDADYFIDNQNIKESDTLFFLTNSQQRILKADSFNTKKIKALFSKKKHSLIILDEVKYPIQSLLYLSKILTNLFGSIFLGSRDENALNILSYAWRDYLDFLPLFNMNEAESMLYFTFPNGHTSFRINDAIITSLCRKSSIKSVGIQSRTIYTTKYEDCFDCFDTYLSWGTAWENISLKRQIFIKETLQVGCLYTEDLRKSFNPSETKKFRKECLSGRDFLVSVFDSDIGDKSHYTFEYARSFILNVAKLAENHSNCSFIIKTKNPKKNQLYLEDDEIKDIFLKKNINIQFLSRDRNDYNIVLNASDIVIAIGYTTPGFEALSLGKRAIYYSELKNGGKAFKSIPNLIAKNYVELKYIFSIALTDYKFYTKENEIPIQELNIFGGSKSKKHIINKLILNPV